MAFRRSGVRLPLAPPMTGIRHNSAVMFADTRRQPMELPTMRPAFRVAGVVALAATGFLFLASPSARADNWHGRGGWHGGGGWDGAAGAAITGAGAAESL
jgi:hypothetical protein